MLSRISEHISTKMETKKLENIRDFLVAIAYEAAEMIISAHPTTGTSGSKKNCKCSDCMKFACQNAVSVKSMESQEADGRGAVYTNKWNSNWKSNLDLPDICLRDFHLV